MDPITEQAQTGVEGVTNADTTQNASSATVTDTEATGQALQPTEEGKNGTGEASTSTSEPEPFFDPTNLPEELQPVYKNMQAAYTQKTQEIAALRKDLNSKLESTKWISDLDTLSQTNPQRAAEIFRVMADKLDGGVAINNNSDESIDLNAVDPFTRQLYEQNQMLLQKIKEIEGRFWQEDQERAMRAKQEEQAAKEKQINDFVDKHFPNVIPTDREVIVSAVRTAIESGDPNALSDVLVRLKQNTVNNLSQVNKAKADASTVTAGTSTGKMKNRVISGLEDAFEKAWRELS